LFGLDVDGLDDRPPLFDLSLLLCGERLRPLLLGRPDFLTELREPLAYRRIGMRICDRRMELCDHILRRLLGRPKPVQERRVEAGHPCLIDPRRLGSCPPSALRHYGVGLYLTATDLRQRTRDHGEGEINLSSYEILDHRRSAPIGNELESSAGILLKVGTDHIRSAADPGDSHRRPTPT